MDNNGVSPVESAMDIDISGESNGSTAGEKENGFVLYPVEQNGSGEGLPYAPVDWPNPGDCWRWKVGKRIGVHGYFIDRSLYVPERLQESKRKGRGFPSKLSAARYIQEKFPGTDIDAFFATFSWKIPGKKSSPGEGSGSGSPIFRVPSEERSEYLESDSQKGGVTCEAGNKACPSLEETGNSSSNVMPCNVCCSEPRFCRECCCILCCKRANFSYGNYSFIRCEAVVEDNYICGHIAHVDCALRTYMAGTVGGSIGLDAEYYCRRCDARTDLVPQVERLLKTCESIDSRTDVENILNVGFRVMRNSEKSSARSLFRRIRFAMEKLETGTSLEEIWRAEDMPTTVTEGLFDNGGNTMATPKQEELLELEALKLEAEIEQVLRALKKAQESEYKIAEERLHAQKDYILHLRQQLDKDRSEISQRSSSNPDELFEAIMDRLDQVKMETQRLTDMKEIAKGFGKTSKDILKDYFDLEIDS